MGRKSLEQMKNEIEKIDLQLKEAAKKEQAKKKDSLKIFRIGSLAKILDIQHEDIETILGYLSFYTKMTSEEKANCKGIGKQILNDRKAQKIIEKYSENVSNSQIKKMQENPNQSLISKFIKDEFNKNLIEELTRTEYKMLNKILKQTK